MFHSFLQRRFDIFLKWSLYGLVVSLTMVPSWFLRWLLHLNNHWQTCKLPSLTVTVQWVLEGTDYTLHIILATHPTKADAFWGADWSPVYEWRSLVSWLSAIGIVMLYVRSIFAFQLPTSSIGVEWDDTWIEDSLSILNGLIYGESVSHNMTKIFLTS